MAYDIICCGGHLGMPVSSSASEKVCNIFNGNLDSTRQPSV